MSYSELKTSQATFRLLHRLEGERGDAREIPQEFDAVLVEMVHEPPIKDLDERVQAYVAGLEHHPDLKKLVSRVKRGKIPVYLGDLAESPSLSSFRDLDLMIVEFFAGIVALIKGVSFWAKKEKKKGWFFKGLGLVFASLWFLSSVVEILGVFLIRSIGNTAKKGLVKGAKETIAAASNLHPEKTVVFLRNLVLAEKAWEIVELEKKDNPQPLILIDCHFGHAGLLKMLHWHRATRRTLLRFYKPFIREILKDRVKRDYLARLVSLVWSGDHWQLQRNYLVDSLEEI